MRQRYRDDPVGFNERVLKRSPYWCRQADIARSVVDYRVTVCYSGNAIGKDFLLGGTIPWWITTRPNALCIVTGVSQTLLGSVTWKEVRRAVEGSPLLRAMELKISNGVKASPQVLEVRPGWHALGYSTTTVERAAGQHAPELLAIINEASGVDDEIYDAIDSLKYKRLLVFGNPLRADGRFVELIRQAAFDRRDGIPPDKAVNAIRIPSTDSPHATMDHSPWGLADKTWIDSMRRQYGKDSLWCRCHIDAIVPEVSADTLLPVEWLDWCAVAERDPDTLRREHPAFATRRITCDLGEGVGRDSTSIFVTDDFGVLDVVFGDVLDLDAAALHFHELGLRWKVPHERMSYDRMGIGRKFHLHLSRLGINAAVGYAGAGKPSTPEFTNLRSEAGMRFHQRLDPQGSADWRYPHSRQSAFVIPPGDYWPRLREELKTLTYHLVKAKTALLSKEDHAKALGHSPDLSDGLLQRWGFVA